MEKPIFLASVLSVVLILSVMPPIGLEPQDFDVSGVWRGTQTFRANNGPEEVNSTVTFHLELPPSRDSFNISFPNISDESKFRAYLNRLLGHHRITLEGYRVVPLSGNRYILGLMASCTCDTSYQEVTHILRKMQHLEMTVQSRDQVTLVFKIENGTKKSLSLERIR